MITMTKQDVDVGLLASFGWAGFLDFSTKIEEVVNCLFALRRQRRQAGLPPGHISGLYIQCLAFLMKFFLEVKHTILGRYDDVLVVY